MTSDIEEDRIVLPSDFLEEFIEFSHLRQIRFDQVECALDGNPRTSESDFWPGGVFDVGLLIQPPPPQRPSGCPDEIADTSGDDSGGGAGETHVIWRCELEDHRVGLTPPLWLFCRLERP
ncbi:MAG: hypothetical protein ACKO3H_13680, partial [Verrucomicrobiota bacterium]